MRKARPSEAPAAAATYMRITCVFCRLEWTSLSAIYRWREKIKRKHPRKERWQWSVVTKVLTCVEEEGARWSKAEQHVSWVSEVTPWRRVEPWRVRACPQPGLEEMEAEGHSVRFPCADGGKRAPSVIKEACQEETPRQDGWPGSRGRL